MGTRNFALLSFSFTLAIGGAFASVLSPEAVFVRAKLSPSGDARCIQTSAQCDYAGTLFCTVTVPTSAIGDVETVTSDGSSGFITYRAGCLVALSGSGHEISGTPAQTIYSLTSEQP
jgi:hypothetical protein